MSQCPHTASGVAVGEIERSSMRFSSRGNKRTDRARNASYSSSIVSSMPPGTRKTPVAGSAKLGCRDGFPKTATLLSPKIAVGQQSPLHEV